MLTEFRRYTDDVHLVDACKQHGRKIPRQYNSGRYMEVGNTMHLPPVITARRWLCRIPEPALELTNNAKDLKRPSFKQASMSDA